MDGATGRFYLQVREGDRMNNRGVNRTLPPVGKKRKTTKPPRPVSRPGFEILVPLELVPEYLAINGLEPEFWDETRDRLLVKKVKSG